MENNSLTPTPAPTPTSANSMPEFAAAPAAPAPVIPPATSMPSFGDPKPSAQTAQDTMSVPVAPAPAPAPAPVEQPAPETQPAETPAQPLGEISINPIPAPQPTAPVQPAPATPVVPTPTPEAQPATAAIPSPVEAGPTVPATPAPQTPEKKKIDPKLLAIIGGAAVLVIAVVIGIVAIAGSSKPASNPTDAPTISYEGPDNSTPFADLEKEGALAFLTAVGKTNSYFPEDFLDETDAEILPVDAEKNSELLDSYETKDQAKTIAFNSMDQAFRAKYAEKNLKTTEKVDYTVVYLDPETVECNDCSRYVSFSSKVVNRVTQPYINPATGAADVFYQTVFTKNTEDSVKRYLPAVVYLTEDIIVYSSEFKTTDTEYQLVANVIYVGLDEEKMATATAGEVPRAINLSTIVYSVDKTTGYYTVKAELSPLNQLKPTKSFSVTDEEVSDLI